MESVQFHFDPRCPWCFQASRWIRRLAELGVIRPSWSLYCLEIANLREGEDPVPLGTTARSATALRTAAMSALAARQLARPDSKTMAIIGLGAQSEFQAAGFRALLGIDHLRLGRVLVLH